MPQRNPPLSAHSQVVSLVVLAFVKLLFFFFELQFNVINSADGVKSHHVVYVEGIPHISSLSRGLDTPHKTPNPTSYFKVKLLQVNSPKHFVK